MGDDVRQPISSAQQLQMDPGYRRLARIIAESKGVDDAIAPDIGRAYEVAGREVDEQMRDLLWELMRVRGELEGLAMGDVVYPKGATVGQWGTIVRNPQTGIKTWVRVMDVTSHKFKITTGAAIPWAPGANVRRGEDDIDRVPPSKRWKPTKTIFPKIFPHV
jgi:hypothetical protein